MRSFMILFVVVWCWPTPPKAFGPRMSGPLIDTLPEPSAAQWATCQRMFALLPEIADLEIATCTGKPDPLIPAQVIVSIPAERVIPIALALQNDYGMAPLGVGCCGWETARPAEVPMQIEQAHRLVVSMHANSIDLSDIDVEKIANEGFTHIPLGAGPATLVLTLLDI